MIWGVERKKLDVNRISLKYMVNVGKYRHSFSLALILMGILPFSKTCLCGGGCGP